MSYALDMGFAITSDEAAEIYLDKLFEGLMEIGFVEDDIQIEKIECESDVVMSLSINTLFFHTSTFVISYAFFNPYTAISYRSQLPPLAPITNPVGTVVLM